VGRAIDITNVAFGRLTAVKMAAKDKHGKTRWSCDCSCGRTEIIVTTENLRKGIARSCGCYQRDATIEANRTHGQSKTRLYRIWKNMLQRATNPDNRDYPRYGGAGRGLDDPSWKKFENFAADMAEGYRDGLTLDRIDGTKGYSKSNCRWATYAQQNSNTRQNKLLTFRGETKPAVEWAESLGMNYRTMIGRLRDGWSVERTLTTPTPTGYRPKGQRSVPALEAP